MLLGSNSKLSRSDFSLDSTNCFFLSVSLDALENLKKNSGVAEQEEEEAAPTW